MYTYGWFVLMYGRNQHNIVKQLFSNWGRGEETIIQPIILMQELSFSIVVSFFLYFILFLNFT